LLPLEFVAFCNMQSFDFPCLSDVRFRLVA
jgi:hypothetical protein